MVSMDRRQALRLGVLGLTLVGTSAGIAQLADARPVAQSDGDDFFEIYKGRRIRGIAGPLPRVFVDDVELHLMRLGILGYTTQLNHYQTYLTPYQTAHAAVDSLNGARLLPFHG
jgi:Tyrosinase co-factor MelC1